MKEEKKKKRSRQRHKTSSFRLVLVEGKRIMEINKSLDNRADTIRTTEKDVRK